MKKIPMAMFAASPFVALAAEPTGTEWKEPENLSFGREERRAAFSSFDTLESALKILPEFSERTISLDSETAWKFKWSPDPASRPVGFEKPSYDVSDWDVIKVPCSWQAYGANGKGGWGTPIYTNQTYPFARNQPDVMGEPPKDWTAYSARNPVGSYRRDFEVPEKWNGEDIFLKFDAVDSFFYLWVNGEYVGFSKDSRNPAEFNVTKFVKPGKNVVALEVYRYSDASYLEDQDMFRLSGIARSTWLLARPKTRIRDFAVTPRPVDENNLRGDWVLEVAVDFVSAEKESLGNLLSDLFDEGVEIPLGEATVIPKAKIAIYDMDGRIVDSTDTPPRYLTLPADFDEKYRMLVHSPKLWSAEEPNCYKLVLSVGDSGHATSDTQLTTHNSQLTTSEYVSCLVGFRTSEIRDGRYYFNNEKIKLRGVNRHETDPMYGHYVPRERQLEDIRLMKEANVNHIRNSHYPQDDYFYYLCDIYGIYVMDEANVESHGYYYGEASLSHRKEWEKATVTRNLDMVRRNRNHPSVTMWSLGNEAGPGENFAAAAAAIREIDTSRPLQYERDNSVVDMDSNQYPGVGWVQWKASDRKAKKPFYISEYAHNMCNAMGNLKDYQDAIESSDVILGAAIWDWVDQGLYKSVDSKSESRLSNAECPKSKDRLILAYGGDFGDVPNDGQFVMNGVILSDRRPEPGYWEVKHVFQPFAFSLSEDRKTLTVKNMNYFRDTSAYLLKIEQHVSEGEPMQFSLAIPPRGSAKFSIPEWKDVAVYLRVEVVLAKDEGLLKKDHVVASEEFEFPDWRKSEERETFSVKGESKEIRDISNDEEVAFTGKTWHDGLKYWADWTIRFDRETGLLFSIEAGYGTLDDGWLVPNRQFLAGAMTVDAFRAPSSNEVGLGDKWAMAGLRELKQKATSISPVTDNPDGSKSFTVVADVRGKEKEHLVGFGGRTGKEAEFVPAGPVSPHDPHFSVAQKWTVFRDGSIACQSEIRPRGRVMEIARIGYRLPVSAVVVHGLDDNRGLGNVGWSGAGPFENYPDRRSGAFLDYWERNVKDMVEGYAKPQDMGNRENTDTVSLHFLDGNYLRVTTLGEPFSFSAIPYTPTELALAMHPEELPKSDKVELGIYAAVRGLGGASCGPGPMGRDIIRNNKPYRLDFIIARRGDFGLPKLPPADLPPDVRTGADIVPTVVACSSAEPGEGDAEHVVDGDLSTIWHSQYGVTLTKYPHSITVDLGRTANAKGVSIWQRQNGPNGNVKGFKFEVSADGKAWREAVAGELKPGPGEQKFAFSAGTVPMRYWRFTGLCEHGGREFASLAEVRIEE